MRLSPLGLSPSAIMDLSTSIQGLAGQTSLVWPGWAVRVACLGKGSLSPHGHSLLEKATFEALMEGLKRCELPQPRSCGHTWQGRWVGASSLAPLIALQEAAPREASIHPPGLVRANFFAGMVCE